MIENLSTSHLISTVLLLLAGVLLLVFGLVAVINKKQFLIGNFRTPRFVTGKYAVWVGLSNIIIGMVLIMNIIFYFIDMEDINSMFCPSAVILVIIALIMRFLGGRDPGLDEIKKVEKEIIHQEDIDPEVQKRRKKIILALVIGSILLGVGIPVIIIIYASPIGQGGKETIIPLLMMIMCLVPGFLLVSLKWFFDFRKLGKW